jgi:membrane protein DedA with SNARE-associated domain
MDQGGTVLATLASLVATYGYIMVALCILLESAGIPVPGETALVLAAAAAGGGHLRIELVMATAAVASAAGGSMGYWIGRRGGRTFIERHGHWIHIDAPKLDRLERFFARHGTKAVFFGRFVAVLRTYAPLFAGISRMPHPTFIIYNTVGAITWAIVFGLIGFLFGQNLAIVEQLTVDFWGAVLAVAVVTIVVVLIHRWRRSRATLLVK